MQSPPGGWGPPGYPPPGYPPQQQENGFAPEVPAWGSQQMMLAPPGPMNLWTCPMCRFQGLTITKSRVSSQGWLVFGILLVFCFPLCWIGLLLKENNTCCPSCNSIVGGPF